jgi:hypothetical protein
MKTITIRIPESLAVWLTGRAKELRRPQSELVRDALERSRRDGDLGNCHDLMMDVCGAVNGPQDLLTNPKYRGGAGR